MGKPRLSLQLVPRVPAPLRRLQLFVDCSRLLSRELSSPVFDLRNYLNRSETSIRIDLIPRILLRRTIILQPSKTRSIRSEGATSTSRPVPLACERRKTMALNQQSENSVMADPASNKVVPDGTGMELSSPENHH